MTTQTSIPYTVEFQDFEGYVHSYTLLAPSPEVVPDLVYDQRRDAIKVLSVRPEEHLGL